MNSNGLKNMILKIVHAIILMTIKIENFDFDNLLIDKKNSSFKINLVSDDSHKTLIGSKPLRIRLGKVDGLMVML